MRFILAESLKQICLLVTEMWEVCRIGGGIYEMVHNGWSYEQYLSIVNNMVNKTGYKSLWNKILNFVDIYAK